MKDAPAKVPTGGQVQVFKSQLAAFENWMVSTYQVGYDKEAWRYSAPNVSFFSLKHLSLLACCI